ncbi:glycerate kinase family protein [Microlunatus antarcticus]|uniref:Glycerate kinase n=1 Tax=Microlunatus antarcticus TaxID=53388 RepID=A0A7W5JVV4_9ACTN|nr:glycerate kinase [Microlunatus antarcticus]
MKVVAAFDSFKGSLSSREAGEAVAEGVRAAVPDAEVVVVGVADGGEGLVDALLVGGGHETFVDAVDPFGRPLRTGYAVLDDGTAVVEAARTIGLDLVGAVDATVPYRASSSGLGLQVAAALASGAPRVLVGLGGSATTDGGTGLLAALGARLELVPEGSAGAGNLLPHVVAVHDLPDLSRVEVLTDVTSPLLGPTGAARMFGPQKGADPTQVEALEAHLTRWAPLLAAASGQQVSAVVGTPGSGAAGGLGAALLACGATLVPGFARVAELVGLDDALVGADLVLTGEGSFDAQSALGKGPVGVADLARARGVPVVVLAGRVEHPLGAVGERVDAAFGVHPVPRTPLEAMDPIVTAAALRATASQVVRLVRRTHGLADAR